MWGTQVELVTCKKKGHGGKKKAMGVAGWEPQAAPGAQAEGTQAKPGGAAQQPGMDSLGLAVRAGQVGLFTSVWVTDKHPSGQKANRHLRELSGRPHPGPSTVSEPPSLGLLVQGDSDMMQSCIRTGSWNGGTRQTPPDGKPS